MRRSWRLVYELSGSRGAVYISTLSRAGAEQLFLARFPAARIVRISEVTT